jgi:hypothetical protein
LAGQDIKPQNLEIVSPSFGSSPKTSGFKYEELKSLIPNRGPFVYKDVEKQIMWLAYHERIILIDILALCFAT